MRFGMNLWALNSAFTKNPEQFLSCARSCGFRYLEPVLAFEKIPGIEERLWTPDDFETYIPLMKKQGFNIYSCHAFADMEADSEKLLDMAKRYGIQQYVFPCPKFTSEAQFSALVGNLQTAIVPYRKAGIEVLFHNGGEVSASRIEGISAYEWMLRKLGPDVGAQADVGWLLYGGVDPEAFLWRNEKQIRSLHYKDMQTDGSQTVEAPVGKGLVDLTACFQFARYTEIIQVIDQDAYAPDVFEDVQFVADNFRALSQCRDRTKSILCIYDVDAGTVEKLQEFDRIIEAPNWMQTDSDTLIYNSEGKIWRYSISKGTESVIQTGHCVNCNNDHVLSPDNRQIAVSHSETGWMSQIYICNIDGTGEPKLITPHAPSFLHGWSFDGKELAYCAFRQKDEQLAVDIYTIPSDGGEERQLTEHAGFNDGPEYAPNNQDLWFISTRTGLMQNWKMNRDGSNPIQMTFCERNNWFPHISPDGKKVVYLSYSKEGLDPNEHLPNMQVQLRMMDYDGCNDRCILEFFGGQGSINVNSWHPDSNRFAFVMYQLEYR